MKCLQCHRIHRTLASQFKYALVWVSELQFELSKHNHPCLLILNKKRHQQHIDTNMLSNYHQDNIFQQQVECFNEATQNLDVFV